MRAITAVSLACALIVSGAAFAGTGSLQRTSISTAKTSETAESPTLKGASGPLGTVGPAGEAPAPKRTPSLHR